MRIGICDDAASELENTKNFCEAYLAQHNIEAEVTASTDWQDFLGKPLPDLMILDIEMPEKSGIVIKDEISAGERPLILFVTGYDEYMPRAFGKNVIGFVRKPIELWDFDKSMDCAVRLLTAGKDITLEDGTCLSTEKIRMFTADKRYTTIIFGDGSLGPLQVRSLSSWEEELADVAFIRINQSQLVNSKYIVDFRDDVITMENGEKLKASRRKKKECFQRFMEYNRKYATHA